MSFTHPKKVKQAVNRILLILFGLYVMITASLYFLQEKVLFLPTVLAQDYQYHFKHRFEELFLKTEKNAVINAIHFKADDPKGVILYFHGNAGNLSRWGTIAEFFVEKKYDVLIIDYRTYGKSIGKLSEQALYHDAEVCYDYLKKQYNEQAITIYGRSLGTGIAAYIASKNSPKHLILETPYYSMVDVAKRRFPIIPVKQLIKYELPTYKFIKDVKCPITMLHGTKDEVIPIESAEKLYHSVPDTKINFEVIESGNHNNLSNYEDFHRLINDVLN